MINQIIDAISLALSSTFGDGYEIYTESVGQGLKEPCFFILCPNPAKRLFLGKRYYRQSLFCIHYFPSVNEKEVACNMVVDRLFQCLEYIDVGDQKIRGTKMNSESNDGVLNFFVNYDRFEMYAYENTNMEELRKTETEVKGK